MKETEWGGGESGETLVYRRKKIDRKTEGRKIAEILQ